MSRFLLSAVVLAGFAVLAPGPRGQGQDGSPAATDAEPRPRYLDAIAAELEALQTGATCEAITSTRGRCRWSVSGSRSGRTFNLEVIYDDGTDTAYLFVRRYLELPPAGGKTPAVLARMMGLNWRLLVGKLEWNPTDGEVRLSAVLNTDSNFDRRAFRSTARALANLADRYYETLAGEIGD